MKTMLVIVATTVGCAFAVGACDSSTSDTACSAPAPCNCTYSGADGGLYQCDSFSMPACPAAAESNAACSGDAGNCMGCSQGAGFTCHCWPASDGGPRWMCVGTEYACKGP